ncbi:aminotransferase class I and II [Thermoleophilia bacterium SCSIO 60948]|nr:aminotransferase class I and II [Thermoleophilia bacterium SCSIO 60948]
MVASQLGSVRATRYVTPLREGGSLPALVEASDDGLYVVKLRGAGQGPKALVAELLAGRLAQELGLPVPELAIVSMPAELALAEPDPEIQELLAASAGENAGLDFLPGALPFSPAGRFDVDPALAARIVWFDALVENVDRTPKNPNLLTWHGELWLIDHGAALYRQHQGLDPTAASGRFDAIRDHVLIGRAGPIADADAELAPRVTAELLASVAAEVPEGWFGGVDRGSYVEYLLARLEARPLWIEAAEEGRARA